jgi:hypothetical protein
MFRDVLITVLASVVIGWNVGDWLVPACWLGTLCLAAVAMRAHGRERTCKGSAAQL